MEVSEEALLPFQLSFKFELSGEWFHIVCF